MKTSLNSPTKYEQTRIDAMRSLGCVACAVIGVPNLNQLELHHLLLGGVRMGHYFTIFLCRGHHQGDWSQLEWIEPKYRVAISDGRKRFVLVYGTERSLWERVQTKLKLPKVWPTSKIVARRVPHVDALRSTASPADAADLLADRHGSPLPPGPAGVDGSQLPVVETLEAIPGLHVGVRSGGRGDAS
jgi:hypothetical protein